MGEFVHSGMGRREDRGQRGKDGAKEEREGPWREEREERDWKVREGAWKGMERPGMDVDFRQ